jgi:tetratricopeptide (TPR) repeat protein
MNEAPQGPSPVAVEVERIRRLLKERRFAEAADAAERLRRDVPQNRDVLYLLALARRQQGAVDAALAALADLVRFHPGFGRAYQEQGLCHVIRKDAPAAIQAFLAAVHINPALPESWRMLEGLYRLVGDGANAANAAGHVSVLARLAPPVVQATQLLSDNEPVAAERIIREHLQRNPDDLEAMRLLGRIGHRLDVLDDAEVLLAEVLARAPDYTAARTDYVRVLLDRHKYREAHDELTTLLAADPSNATHQALEAAALVGLGEHEGAIERYRRLIPDADPVAAADLELSLAHSLKTLGRTDEAIAAYTSAAARRPAFGDAYWSLANLKTYRFTDAEIDAMQAALADPSTSTTDRYHLCFALGKAAEDRGDYAASFGHYQHGNALKRAESRYRPDPIELNTANQRRVCTRAFFGERADYGLDSRAPIFIVGLPRSGSTLLEQILASHPLVEGTQELADIPRIVLDLQGREPDLANPRYPACLVDLTPDDVRRLAQRYLNDTAVYRTGKAHFIDKMPNNFRHVGLIHLLFPNAKIIDARREPMACCFSNFKQLFARGQEFTYSLEDIARYYRTYLELMTHWDDVLPGRVLRVHHEDVVDDLESNVRRLLDYCELPFDPACVAFHKTARAVRTASSEQVRRPIFREGLDQWRHFEPWLAPLARALDDAPERYRA